jgi:hypothetical protein
VTGAVIVTTLQMRAALHTAPGIVSDVPSELSTLVYSLDAVLILVAVTTLVAVVLLSIPLGIGLYLGVLGLTSGTVHGAVLAPWWHVALVPVAVAAAVATTTQHPGPARRRGTGRRGRPLRVTAGQRRRGREAGKSLSHRSRG